jgi:hypothetical protein
MLLFFEDDGRDTICCMLSRLDLVSLVRLSMVDVETMFEEKGVDPK